MRLDIEYYNHKLKKSFCTFCKNGENMDSMKLPYACKLLLQAIYVLYADDGALKLPYCIVVAGFVCALFAFGIPHLSALRIWLGFSTFFSLVYIVIAFALSLKDGIKAPPRDYSIPRSHATKIFSTIGAVANLVFAYNTGMLPEIQATIKPPVVRNMDKALWFQFTVGGLPLYAVTFIGYWAYGNSSSSYLLNNVNGPTWVKTVANVAAFLQTVIALHVPLRRICSIGKQQSWDLQIAPLQAVYS